MILIDQGCRCFTPARQLLMFANVNVSFGDRRGLVDECIVFLRRFAVPYRLLAASKLGELLSAIAHPRRIQIIEELSRGESDVGTLKKALGVSHSNVSQHLAMLRAHRVVAERRKGRHVFYRLRSLDLAEWLVNGMRFLPDVTQEVEEVKNALRDAKAAWTTSRVTEPRRGPATDD